MEWLIDCEIIEYCKSSTDERQRQVSDLPYVSIKPVYVLPIFEVCRAFHLLYKYYQIKPGCFRKCWANLSKSYWGEWLHVSEYPKDNFAREIRQIIRKVENPDHFPCGETAQKYWGFNRPLTERIRALVRRETIVEDEIRTINGPYVFDFPVGFHKEDSEDIVIDTNNFIELLNQLPEDGLGVNLDEMHFPKRLSEKAVRLFKTIIRSYGIPNRLIVPLIVIEETERVVNYEKNFEKYKKARSVIQAMAFDPNLPLWNMFFFEPLNQDVFECLLQLYEGLYSPRAEKQYSPGFADAIILAHGIYNRCAVASNEWFEKDDWKYIAGIFPYLVLKDD